MSAAQVAPYLFFAGRCEEALDFYKTAVGAKVEFLMRYNESPEPPPPGRLQPGFENKVMHVSFKIGDSTLMASDGCDDNGGFRGFSLSYSATTVAEADRAFAALSEGGTVNMPMAPTFWTQKFGMLTDKFGLEWMVTVAH